MDAKVINYKNTFFEIDRWEDTTFHKNNLVTFTNGGDYFIFHFSIDISFGFR